VVLYFINFRYTEKNEILRLTKQTEEKLFIERDRRNTCNETGGQRILLTGVLFGLTPVYAANISLDLQETTWELKPGLSTKVWSYNGTVPGFPIIVAEGERVVVRWCQSSARNYEYPLAWPPGPQRSGWSQPDHRIR